MSYEKPRVRKGWIEKRYSREDLLIGGREQHERLARITEVTKDPELSPVTRFRWDADRLTLTQGRVSPAPSPVAGSPAVWAPLRRLAGKLDDLSSTLVHGDITRKNLVYDGKCFQLVDWEPALRQRRSRRATLMYTEPYLSERDRFDQRLSVETDKISFFFVCWRFIHGGNPIERARDLVRARTRREGAVTPIPECDFLELPFRDLPCLAKESGQWSPCESRTENAEQRGKRRVPRDPR